MNFDQRAGVRTRLERCFRGFGPEMISCRYELTAMNVYACHMTIRNPVGNEFSTISGQHVAGQGNNNVQTVDIIGGNTRNIPQIICQQFPQLSAMLAFDDFIDTINPQAFSTCRNLRQLHLGDNVIMSVPDNTFSNSPLLEELYFGTNRIVSIAPNAFAGTVINFLDLSYNHISALNPAWFTPIASTLRVLDLISSGFTEIPSDTFTELTGLTELFINTNRLTGLNRK
jgi:Leucine-rich repeat (LRR) protein